MHIVCECADGGCTETLVVPLQGAEQIRSDPALFFVKPGHEILAVEYVVDEVANYRVVRKRPGEGEQNRKTDRPSAITRTGVRASRLTSEGRGQETVAEGEAARG